MTFKFQNEIITSDAEALDIKADARGRITGYGAVFSNVDRQGDKILPGAFTKSLERIEASGEMPVMLWSHAQEQPIGRWSKVFEDDKGLRVEGVLNLNTDRGQDAYEHVKAGDTGGLSIGYTTPKGGREYVGGGIFHLKEVELFEVSVVAIPCNPQARIEGVKSLTSKAQAVDMLRGCGLSRKAAQRFAAGGWPALNSDHDQERIAKLAGDIEQITQAIRKA